MRDLSNFRFLIGRPGVGRVLSRLIRVNVSTGRSIGRDRWRYVGQTLWGNAGSMRRDAACVSPCPRALSRTANAAEIARSYWLLSCRGVGDGYVQVRRSCTTVVCARGFLRAFPREGDVQPVRPDGRSREEEARDSFDRIGHRIVVDHTNCPRYQIAHQRIRVRFALPFRARVTVV